MTLHRTYILLTFSGVLLLCVFYLQSQLAVAKSMEKNVPAQRQLVSALTLTDLSIWTEARYTRHPSQADLFTAFQDLPSALEHFPAGSIISPLTVEVDTRMEFRRTGSRAQP